MSLLEKVSNVEEEEEEECFLFSHRLNQGWILNFTLLLKPLINLSVRETHSDCHGESTDWFTSVSSSITDIQVFYSSSVSHHVVGK